MNKTAALDKIKNNGSERRGVRGKAGGRIVSGLVAVLMVISLSTAGGCFRNEKESNDFTNLLFLFLLASTCEVTGGAKQGTACLSLNLTNTTSLLAGNQSTTGLVNASGTAARFNSPNGITSDRANLYIADTTNHVIRKIVIATGEVTTLAGSGSAGSADGTGTAATFSSPYGITRVGDFLYVGEDGNDAIRRITISTGEVTTFAGSAGNPGLVNGTGTAARFNNPYGLTSDGVNLYVSEAGNYTIRQIVIATGVVTTVAGSGVMGSANGTGTAATFTQPWDVVHKDGILYVPDIFIHAVRQVVIATGEVTTFAGEIGTSGSTDAVGTSARFNSPRGITHDGTYFYVTESSNSTIRRIDIATGQTSTIVGQTGNAGHTEGTGTSATLTFPAKITTDGIDLFFGGATFNYIRKVD